MLVSDAAAVEFEGREPWPNDVRLFQPYENSQILLPDFAVCLSVKAFLKMCDLPFREELRVNAEYMSPSGRVPFVQLGKLLVSEFEPIIATVANKGHNLSSHLTDEQRTDMKAYMALIDNTLAKAELYICWCNPKILKEVTRVRYGSPFPWPLNVLLPWREGHRVNKMLASTGWTKKTFDEVCEEVRRCCEALAERLGEQEFFFGDKPTELDAIVYGHLFTILTTELPDRNFAEVVESYPNLASFSKRIDDKYFKDLQLHHES